MGDAIQMFVYLFIYSSIPLTCKQLLYFIFPQGETLQSSQVRQVVVKQTTAKQPQ